MRRRYTAARGRIPPGKRAAFSRHISRYAARFILRTLARRAAAGASVQGGAALYLAFGTEASLDACLSRLQEAQVPVCLPAERADGSPCFRRFTPETLAVRMKGGFRGPGQEAEECAPCVLLVPATSCDASGARLGYGRGFYDRAVSHLTQHGRRSILSAAVIFNAQFHKGTLFPRQIHDLGIHIIITEKGIFPTTNNKINRNYRVF